MGNKLSSSLKQSKPKPKSETRSSFQYRSTEDLIYDNVLELFWESTKTDLSRFYTLVETILELQAGLQLEEPPEREEAIPVFVKWCSRNRIEVADGLEITTYPNLGLGLNTKQALKANNCVLVVPRNSSFSSKIVEDDLFTLLLNSGLASVEQPVPSTLKLLSERLKGVDSVWKPYIDMLPQKIPHSLYFGSKEFESLYGSPCYQMGILYSWMVVTHYCLLYMEIYAAWEKGQQYLNFVPSNFTLDMYRWSFAIVLTRSVCNDYNKQSEIYLVPYWDLFNHGEENVCTYTKYLSVNSLETALFAYTIRDVMPGEQLIINYNQDVTPLQLFATWGIYNLKCYSPIRIRVAQDDKNYSAKCSKLSDSTVNLTVYPNEMPLSAADFQSLLIITATTVDLETRNISQITWLRAWNFLSKRIMKHLRLYFVVIDRTEASFKQQCNDNVQMQLVTKMVTIEMEILLKALAACTLLLNASPTEKLRHCKTLFGVHNGFFVSPNGPNLEKTQIGVTSIRGSNLVEKTAA